MRKLNRACAAAVGWLALTGAAPAMPLGQPGSQADVTTADAGLRMASWWCFQYGNCVWRPDTYAPYGNPYYGPGYRYPRPRYYGYYGPRWRRW